MLNVHSYASIAAKRKSCRINKKKCIVCGAPPTGFTGYVYFETGQTRLFAPFCKQHLDEVGEYANPIFENQTALELFQKTHRQEYLKYVKDKNILFFNQSKTENST